MVIATDLKSVKRATVLWVRTPQTPNVHSYRVIYIIFKASLLGAFIFCVVWAKRLCG